MGIASASYQHGRYSSALPARLRERYAEAMRDPDLLNLHSEIALIDSRVGDLLAKLDVGEAGEMWENLRKMVKAYDKADPDDKPDVLREVFFAINKGCEEYQSWGEVFQLLEQRRRCTETERRRLADMGAMIRAEEAMLVVDRLSHVIRQHVNDKQALAAIAEECRRLFDKGGMPARHQ